MKSDTTLYWAWSCTDGMLWWWTGVQRWTKAEFGVSGGSTCFLQMRSLRTLFVSGDGGRNRFFLFFSKVQTPCFQIFLKSFAELFQICALLTIELFYVQRSVFASLMCYSCCDRNARAVSAQSFAVVASNNRNHAPQLLYSVLSTQRQRRGCNTIYANSKKL